MKMLVKLKMVMIENIFYYDRKKMLSFNQLFIIAYLKVN